jgi:hypothetical protein
MFEIYYLIYTGYHNHHDCHSVVLYTWLCGLLSYITTSFLAWLNKLNYNCIVTPVLFQHDIFHFYFQVQFATQAVFEKLPQPHPTAQLSGFLFLQLTVSELGICLPLYNLNQVCIRACWIAMLPSHGNSLAMRDNHIVTSHYCNNLSVISWTFKFGIALYSQREFVSLLVC